MSPSTQQVVYVPSVQRSTYQQPYAPKPVFPTANYAQRPTRQAPQNNHPPQQIVPITHIKYKESQRGMDDYTDDYVKGESGELIPM